ncbi:hypothetical protein H112_04149 [Trichophyton rubrum D6]|uniref:Uncharacterized protein n=3 Tax=Trichophyton TaxID=5550 RepID=A0A080WMJ6_TRIRC|nr:uncharacterized protein TERG_12080 [Trichophyton rubrum CBS 118892]EZF23162.1 hypothetical protein H100_04154 [Trichophyton rubrum MR850]EZF42207.1 hypothetical protein H102_04142 [Trichophyton rubrum CBS 100081]EZF52856.1 hypothetical protein H103_04153 [Trichophyton rubrum CBS 288.86]EZF63456.1 hypothetical protein H104_04139 [Trichophyton rubrum CBS 289.86]EZF74044.1 hypothetical protein H105_04171 [Trichophyton soudanense CBS 452.61]EZF84767.1 hypothetical protein H110_04146 [Trichophy
MERLGSSFWWTQPGLIRTCISSQSTYNPPWAITHLLFSIDPILTCPSSTEIQHALISCTPHSIFLCLHQENITSHYGRYHVYQIYCCQGQKVKPFGATINVFRQV